jgi:hypothetical protein
MTDEPDFHSRQSGRRRGGAETHFRLTDALGLTVAHRVMSGYAPRLETIVQQSVLD